MERAAHTCKRVRQCAHPHPLTRSMGDACCFDAYQTLDRLGLVGLHVTFEMRFINPLVRC